MLLAMKRGSPMSRLLFPCCSIVALALVMGCAKDEAPADEVSEAVTEGTPTAEPATEAPPLRPVTEGDLDAAKAVVQRGFDLVKVGDCDALSGLMAEAMSAEECQTWTNRVTDNDVKLAKIVQATAATDPGDTIEVKVKLDSKKAQGQDLTVRVARRGDDWKLLR